MAAFILRGIVVVVLGASFHRSPALWSQPHQGFSFCLEESHGL